MSFVVREHYVPKFLLSQFTGCDGNLWVYDKAEVNWFQSTPTKVGIEKNIYDQSVEKWLSAEIEAPVSSIFRDLDSGKKDLSEEELFLISKFIAVQRVRVRAIETFTELNQPSLIHDKLKATFYDLAGKSGVEAGSQLLAQAEQDPSAFLKQNGLHNLCNLALIGAMHDDDFEIAKSMVQMAWRIIRPEDDRYIVTDNPAVIGIPHEVNESRECVLPVSKTCAIHVSEYGSAGMINETVIDDELVEILNIRILAGSRRFIFAPRKEDWISRNAHRKVPNQPHLTFGAELIPASQ